MFQRLRCTNLGAFINPKSSQHPQRSFLRCRERCRDEGRGRRKGQNSTSVWGVNWDSSFCTLILRVATRPFLLASLAAPQISRGGKEGKKVDRGSMLRDRKHFAYFPCTIREPSDPPAPFQPLVLPFTLAVAYRRFAISRNRLCEGAGWNGLHTYAHIGFRGRVISRDFIRSIPFR